MTVHLTSDVMLLQMKILGWYRNTSTRSYSCVNSSETSGFIRGWGFKLDALYITIVMSHDALIIHLTWVRRFCKTGGNQIIYFLWNTALNYAKSYNGMNKWYCRWQTVKEFWFSLDFSRCFTLCGWCANQIKLLNCKEEILNKVALLEDFYCEAPAESKKLWLTLSPGGPGGPSLPAVPCNTKQQALCIYHFMTATHLSCLDRDCSRSAAT